MLRNAFLLLTVAFCLSSVAEKASAVLPSEQLLPPTTKGYVSVPDVDLVRERFDKMQLGKLANDPVIKPFVEDLRVQLEAKLGQTGVRLNIKLEDLEDVYGGEVALATIQPKGDENLHAIALLVDITGKAQQTKQLILDIDKQLREQGSERSIEKVEETSVITYTLPKDPGETEGRKAIYFTHDSVLVATDNADAAQEILARLQGEDLESLADVEGFVETMARCQKAAEGRTAHIRWFVEPFGYAEAVRAATGGRKRRGTDILKVLENQGFPAIKGIGGSVFLYENQRELEHKTYIYAPPVNEEGDKYNLAMRMLDFPNKDDLDPQAWVPNTVSNYLTFYWNMADAFEHSKTLVDEVAGAEIFEDVIHSLEHDPYGPKIKIREGLVQQLGQRVTFFSDYREPITPTSERWLGALEVTNPAVVQATLDKAMEADPDAHKREIGEQVVWEILEPEEDEDIPELEIDGPGFGEFGEFEEEEFEEEAAGPLIPNIVLTVAKGHLIVASRLDYMEEILTRTADAPQLSDEEDFQAVLEGLKELGAGQNSFRYFTRTDKATYPTYELIRQGKMPESESLLGGVLNNVLAPEEEGEVREQQIKGDKMPEFSEIRKYFGPAGLYVVSEEEGWLISGCLLEK